MLTLHGAHADVTVGYSRLSYKLNGMCTQRTIERNPKAFLVTLDFLTSLSSYALLRLTGTWVVVMTLEDPVEFLKFRAPDPPSVGS